MRALIDTHVFLWWITSDMRLSALAKSLIGDPTNTIYVSAASGWEIATKAALGKLLLPDTADRYVPKQLSANDFTSLPMTMEHSLATFGLPFHHRDPFDRILVAQAIIEGMPIISGDALIAQYAAK